MERGGALKRQDEQQGRIGPTHPQGDQRFSPLPSHRIGWLVFGLLLVQILGVASLALPGQAKRERYAAPAAPFEKEGEGVVGRGQDPAPSPRPDPERPVPPAASRDGEELDADPIRIESTLVVVPVSVTDQAGQPVRNLTVNDFLLREEGQPQQIQSLGDPGKTPLELALLFDVSRSIRNRFEFEKEAAARFLRLVLKSGDAVTLFTIGQSSHLTLDRTDDQTRAIGAVQAILPSDEATAFFDTVSAAAEHLESQATTGARRVMVVLSDGDDNNSQRAKLDDALRATQASNSLFYAINPNGPSIRLNRLSIRGHEGMARLARETGGMAFLPDRIEDLTAVFSQIAAELEAQYLLGYYPSDEAKAGQFRRINVTVPSQPSLRIRAREGYYAARDH
jgi:Ca-activated chloride channel family protein